MILKKEKIRNLYLFIIELAGMSTMQAIPAIEENIKLHGNFVNCSLANLDTKPDLKQPVLMHLTYHTPLYDNSE